MSKVPYNSETEIQNLENLAHWLDSRFQVPGTQLRFGLDSIIGLIPGVGDSFTFMAAIYLIGKARAYNLPFHVTMQMLWNAFIDWLVGLIPLVGDIFDFGWKANNKNIALLKKHLQS